MMEKSSFFNAELVGESYDRTYLAEDYAEYFSSFIGNGVFPNPSTNLQIIADGTSMNVFLKKGKAWINGYFYYNTDDLILPIQPADGVLNRLDRVVLRLDFLKREIKCYIKKGAFASTPTAPGLQRDADMYELGIADIKVNKGAIKITQADITDLRQNSSYCGIVHGTIEQIDVTTLFNQYSRALELKEQGFEQEFQTWFSNIKGQLSGDVAGNLAVQINEVKSSLGEKVSKNDYVANNAFATTSGTATAYTVTLNPTPTALVDGMQITILPHVDCGATPTLNINGLGALAIVKQDGSAVVAGDIKANKPLSLVRVGSNFFIRSGSGEVVLKAGNQGIGFNGVYESNTQSDSYQEKQYLNIYKSGVIRVTFTLRANTNYANAYGRIYINGVARGIERYNNMPTTMTFTEDFTVNKNDKVSLYLKMTSSGFTAYGSITKVGVDANQLLMSESLSVVY